MLRVIPCLLILLPVLSGCWYLNNKSEGHTPAYVPVYGPVDETSNKISIGPAREVTKAGKIFVIGEKLFQVEDGAGIHIIDYSDRTKPRRLAFLTVPGCREVASKGGAIFTNHFEDMVVLDLSAYPEVKEASRIKDVFPGNKRYLPPEHGYFYECPDPAKGSVVRWEKKSIKQPNCYHP